MIINVPKPAGKANKDRPINTLLQHQVKRLWEIEQSHIPAHRTGIAIDPNKLDLMTEGEAAKFIKRMTTKLQDLGRKPTEPRKTVAKKAKRGVR
jgi:hypothetical protein